MYSNPSSIRHETRTPEPYRAHRCTRDVGLVPCHLLTLPQVFGFCAQRQLECARVRERREAQGVRDVRVPSCPLQHLEQLHVAKPSIPPFEHRGPTQQDMTRQVGERKVRRTSVRLMGATTQLEPSRKKSQKETNQRRPPHDYRHTTPKSVLEPHDFESVENHVWMQNQMKQDAWTRVAEMAEAHRLCGWSAVRFRCKPQRLTLNPIPYLTHTSDTRLWGGRFGTPVHLGLDLPGREVQRG